jgi:hypothetical protein
MAKKFKNSKFKTPPMLDLAPIKKPLERGFLLL